MGVNNNRAQSLLEYSFLLAVLIAALLSMQIYAKRAIQGRLRLNAEELGEQYAPGHVNSNSASQINSTAVEATIIRREADGRKSPVTTVNTTEDTSRVINATVVRE